MSTSLTSLGRIGATALMAAAGLTSTASWAADTSTPAAYCKSTGGAVQAYTYFDAGNRDYAKVAKVCNYPDASGTDPFGHAIVDIDTLYAVKPTLAALAYHFKPAWDGKRVTGQPAKDYCLQLGAKPTSSGSYRRKVTDGEIGMCLFEDGSFMEEWTLFYNQAGTPRGVNLVTVLRFTP